MNLPTKITVARLVLTVFIILLLCIPYSFFVSRRKFYLRTAWAAVPLLADGFLKEAPKR